MVKHFIWSDKAITLPYGISHISLRQMIVQSWQHLVNALSDRIEGEFVDNIKIRLYL